MTAESQRRSFDLPARLLARLAVRHPRAAYPLASAVGALRNRVTGRWPSPEEVLALFAGIDAGAARRVAAEMGALHERNLVLVRTIVRSGIDPVRPLVTVPESLLSMRGPLLLATFHVGALHALGPALERFETPVLSFRHGLLYQPRGSLTVQSALGTEQERAAAFHRALVHLRGGGVVALALDVTRGPSVTASCLGHPLRLAQGAFALARSTGAPIVPLVGRWTGSRVSVVDRDPLPTPTPEAAAAWLDHYLRESPSQMSLGLMRGLLYDVW